MKYIYKTLTNDESVESFLYYHWWFFIPTILWMMLVIFLYIASLDIESKPDAILSFSPILVFILFIQAFSLFIKWIEYITTEQVLTNKRVFLKVGWIRRDTDELKKDAIETISSKQSILGRILKFGEIDFTGRGGIAFKFKYVRNPTEVKRSFENL